MEKEVLINHMIGLLPSDFPPGLCNRLKRSLLGISHLSQDEGGVIKGLSDQAFQKIFEQITSRQKTHDQPVRLSYKSRQRIRSALLQAAHIWQKAGLIVDIPSLVNSPQHRRTQVLHVDYLMHYRHSDYQTLLKRLFADLTGFHHQPNLLPDWLDRHLPSLGVLLMVACGACYQGCFRHLLDVSPKDVPQIAGYPLKLKRDRGMLYLHLPDLVHLLLLALVDRNRDPEKLFNWNDTKKKGIVHLREFLQFSCSRYSLPPITLRDFVHHSRFEMRMVLNNTEMGVLLGQIRYNPLPEDQCLEGSEIVRIPDIQFESRPEVEQIAFLFDENGHEPPPEEETPMDWENEYRTCFKSMQAYLDFMIETGEIAPQMALWAKEPVNEEDPITTNLRLLVRWQIALIPQAKSLTRKAYWGMVWKSLVENWPDIPIFQINEEELLEVFHTYKTTGSAGKFRSAWRSLFHSLNGQQLPELATINWQLFSRRWEQSIVREITLRDLLVVIAQLELAPGSPDWGVLLSALAGLRVRENSRLLARDLVEGEEPYLTISRSKRGKSRRVPLELMPEAMVQWLLKCRKNWMLLQKNSNPYLMVERILLPVPPEAISRLARNAFEKIGMRDSDLAGRLPTIHRLRALAGSLIYHQTGDVRAAALLLGHSLPATTTQSYLGFWDRDILHKMQSRRWVFQSNTDYIPLVVAAYLLNLTDRGAVEAVKNFNQENQPVIQMVPANALIDGERPSRHGRPALYLSVNDTLRLVLSRLS